MSDLGNKVIKKISERAALLHEKAESKCTEARQYVTLAAEANNPEYIYQAVESYISAAELYPALVEPYLGIAYICWKFDSYENARSLLNKALQIDPLNPACRNMLAEVERDLKQESLKIVSGNAVSPVKANQRSDKGLFSKILDVFSFGKGKKVSVNNEKTGKPGTLPGDYNKEKFMNSVNNLTKVIQYEKISVKANQETLNKIARAVNAQKYQASDGSNLPSAIPSLSLFDDEEDSNSVNISQLQDMDPEKINHLTSLRDNHNKNNPVIKLSDDKFSVFKKVTG
jgi:tetratricopeptide (TPR) repeat protein